MPVGRQLSPSGRASRLWPSGGMHLWPSGGTSSAQSHARGHLVHAAQGVLSVHTEHGTSIVPANRVAWTPAGFTHYHRAHGQTDMRILFLSASLARLLPDGPAVFTVSDLARAALLTLTGPRNYDDAGPGWDRAARSRLRLVLVDELRAAPEQPLQLPEPRDDRLRAVARELYGQPADNRSLAELGRAAGASARTLSRLLHDELGRVPSPRALTHAGQPRSSVRSHCGSARNCGDAAMTAPGANKAASRSQETRVPSACPAASNNSGRAGTVPVNSCADPCRRPGSR
jgi:hypothetical protein